MPEKSMPDKKIERKLKLIDTARDLEERRAERRDAAYMAREMLLCTLPHRDPHTTLFKRDAGDAVLFVQSGFSMAGDLYGIPFGILPRLLMYWLVSEVKRTGKREIELLGENDNTYSYAAFMRELGLDPTRGGKRSDFERLKDAMLRLFSARIVLYYRTVTIEHIESDHMDQFLVATKRRMWWDKKTSEQGAPSWVELGEELFSSINRSVVPADMRALKALTHSPLAMDLYGLLNYFGANQPRMLRWEELQRRLGTGYTDLRDLRRAVRDTLPDVLKVHPGLKAEIPEEGGGIRVHPSEPAIPRIAQKV